MFETILLIYCIVMWVLTVSFTAWEIVLDDTNVQQKDWFMVIFAPITVPIMFIALALN